MHQSLFAGRRLRASYRNVPMDNILALLSEVNEQDNNFIDSYCLRPLRRFRMKDREEQ